MRSLLSRAQSSPEIWLLVLFLAVLLIQGPALIDTNDFLIISADPWHILTQESREFLYTSPFNFIVASVLRLNSPIGFYVIHGVGIGLMLWMVASAVRKKFESKDAQIRFLSLLALTPLWMIVVKWIGKTDPLLFGLLFFAWANPNRWRLLCGTLMVVCHREVGSLMCLMLFFLEGCRDSNLIVAVLAGNGLQFIYHTVILEHPPQGREGMILVSAQKLLAQVAEKPLLYLASIFSWYWVVVILNKPNVKEYLLFAVALGLALVCEDFTRDFTLAAMPALLFHLERVVRDPANNRLAKLFPLAPLQFQMAAVGKVYAANNALLFGLAVWAQGLKL